MLTMNERGMIQLTAGGVVSFSKQQTIEAFNLLDAIKRRGRSDPAFLLQYMHLKAPALEPILASGLAERGYSTKCRLCARQLGAEKFSKFTLRHTFGLNVTRSEMKAHRRHALRRRSSWHGTDLGRPKSSREMWEPPPPSQNEQGRNLLQGKDAVPSLPDDVSASVLLGEIPTTWNGA
jgi:hypothetical protein